MRMRKRALSVMLSFSMVLGMMPESLVLADGTETQHIHGEIEFTQWTDDSGLPDSAGNYYLTEDVKLVDSWNVPTGTVNLCLNGHSVTMTAEDQRVIYVPTDSILNLYDNEENSGTITGGVNSGIGAGVLVEGGNFVMNGGTISGNRITGSTAAGFNCGGGVCVNGGSFIMNDGVISGNIGGLSQGSSQYHKGGGGVAVVGGSFEMNGGEIKENTANNGAAIFAYNGVSVTINGGHIYSNTANASGGAMYGIYSAAFYINGGKIYENSANLGGAIWMTYRSAKGGTLHLAGGEIYDNYSSSATGGVAFNTYSSLYLSGSPKVYGNVYGDDNTECNISLNNNNNKIQFDGELSEDASLGIMTDPLPTEDNARVFTNNLAEFGTVDNFYSDIRGYIVKESETGEAQLEVADPISATVTFKVVNGYWDDVEPESSEDITVTINGYEGEELVLDESQIPAVGNSPIDKNYKAGSWDVVPDTTTAITGAVTYTYTYGSKDAPEIITNPEAKNLQYYGSMQKLVTAGEADGGTFKYALGSLDAPEEEYSETIPTAAEIGTYYVWCMVEGDDDHCNLYADGPLTVEIADSDILEINDEDDWETLVKAVDMGYTFEDKVIVLNSYIQVSTMVGTKEHPFKGTFDGQGCTLTFIFEGNVDNIAPFRFVSDATIKNLCVNGYIETSGKWAAGFVSEALGALEINSCESSIVIQSNVVGDGTHGGFVAGNFRKANNGVQFIDCLFDGTISGENTTLCGGFLGWPGNNEASFTNCFNAGMLRIGTDPQDLSGTFTRVYQADKLTFTNCYYVNAVGTVQGTQVTNETPLEMYEKLGNGWKTNTFYVVPACFVLPCWVEEDPEAKELKYTGEEQELVTEGLIYCGKILYALGTETEATEEYSETIPTGTEAGTYYVWYSVIGEGYGNETYDLGPIEVKIAAPITTTVTFKVVNGYWDDVEPESSEDITVTINGYEGEELVLDESQIPAVGNSPIDKNYKAGSWDVTPDTTTEITEDVTYTYTYNLKDAPNITVNPEANTLVCNFLEQELVTAGEAEGGTFKYALGSLDAPEEDYSETIPVTSDAGKYYVWWMVEGDDDHIDIYADEPIVVEMTYRPIIDSSESWDAFAEKLESGNHFNNVTVYLVNDIKTSTMAGSDSHPFMGTFDGQGHTITVEYETDEEYAALFRFANNATIKNLRVTGYIETSAKFAAGFCADTKNLVEIDSCISSVNIYSSVDGDGTHAGFVASNYRSGSWKVIFNNCLFDGSIVGENTTHCAGFLGWSGYSFGYFNNCFNAGTINLKTNDGSATFARVNTETIYHYLFFENSYYVNSTGTVQGTRVTNETPLELCEKLGDGWKTNTFYVVPACFTLPCYVEEIPEANDLDYSGESQKLVTEGVVYCGKILYALGNETEPTEEYSETVPTGTEAGTYYVWYSVIGEEEGNETYDLGPIEVKIAAPVSATVTFKVVNGYWDDTDPESADDITVTLNGFEGKPLLLDESQIPAVGNSPVDNTYKAGSWDVTPDTTTEITEDVTFTYTYELKAAPEINANPEANSLSYNFLEQELVTAGEVVGGTFMYALGSLDAPEEDYSETIPTASEAGTYYVWYMVKGDEDHLDYIADEPIAVDIDLVVVETIASEYDWNYFAYSVSKGITYEGETVTLTNDITVSTIVGTATRPFRGIFQGNGHTITFNYTAAGNSSAPFRRVEGAEFYNLKVTGTINTAYKYAAGFAVEALGNTIFDGCWSNITINSTVNGDGTHGGFVAYLTSSENNSVIFRNCLFDGVISGETTHSCGGFLGFPRDLEIQFINCLYNGETDTLTDNSATFTRVSNPENITFDNSYYVTPYGLVQGEQTDKTKTELRDQLIGESPDKTWIYSGGMVVPKSFKQSAVISKDPVANELYERKVAQELVTAGEAEGGQMMYALGTDATTAPDAASYSVDIPKGTTAGTYYVWFMVEGDEDNYSVYSDSPVEVTISYVERDVDIVRISGDDRFATSIASAEALKEKLAESGKLVDGKFANIVVASGLNFADALSGSYLAAKKDAPVILVADGKVMNTVTEYVLNNIAEGGTIYILGGTGAVSAAFEESLGKEVKVVRLAGKDRYETNLLILEEAGVEDGEDILVCNGQSFADSISASATGKAILLVAGNRILNDGYHNQDAFLKDLGGSHDFYIIGGTGVVTEEVASALAGYNMGEVERLAGNTRYETSVAILNAFYEYPETVTLVYAENFPDGLSAGPVAYAYGEPIVLANNSNKAISILEESLDGALDDVRRVNVFGGETLISDESAYKIVGFEAEAVDDRE